MGQDEKKTSMKGKQKKIQAGPKNLKTEGPRMGYVTSKPKDQD